MSLRAVAAMTAVVARLLTDERPRCWRCHRVLAERVTRPWEIVCSRCNATNASEPLGARGD